jgi:hypothetical protein
MTYIPSVHRSPYDGKLQISQEVKYEIVYESHGTRLGPRGTGVARLRVASDVPRGRLDTTGELLLATGRLLVGLSLPLLSACRLALSRRDRDGRR